MEMISNKVVVLGSIIRVTVDSKVVGFHQKLLWSGALSELAHCAANRFLGLGLWSCHLASKFFGITNHIGGLVMAGLKLGVSYGSAKFDRIEVAIRGVWLSPHDSARSPWSYTVRFNTFTILCFCLLIIDAVRHFLFCRLHSSLEQILLILLARFYLKRISFLQFFFSQVISVPILLNLSKLRSGIMTFFSFSGLWLHSLC